MFGVGYTIVIVWQNNWWRCFYGHTINQLINGWNSANYQKNADADCIAARDGDKAVKVVDTAASQASDRWLDAHDVDAGGGGYSSGDSNNTTGWDRDTDLAHLTGNLWWNDNIALQDSGCDGPVV